MEDKMTDEKLFVKVATDDWEYTEYVRKKDVNQKSEEHATKNWTTRQVHQIMS